MSDVTNETIVDKDSEIAVLEARLAQLKANKSEIVGNADPAMLFPSEQLCKPPVDMFIVAEDPKVAAANALLTREHGGATSGRKGRRFEVDPAPAKVGEVVQLFAALPAGATIENVEVCEGFEIVQIILGSTRHPTVDGQGSWRDALGRQVQPQAFTVVLAANRTGQPAIAEGAFWLSGTDAQPAAVQPIVQPGPVPVAHVPAAQVLPAPVAAPPPPPRQSRVVTPGNNEVAVLLQRSECMRLFQALSGGLAISDIERPSILRQLQAALERV